MLRVNLGSNRKSGAVEIALITIVALVVALFVALRVGRWWLERGAWNKD